MLRNDTLAEMNHILQRVIDSSIEITDCHAVSGGCINQAAHCLTNLGISFFVKLNSATKKNMFDNEMLALNALRESKTVMVPKPIATGKAGSQAFLILEYLSLERLKDEFLFGQQLAKMHQHTSNQFGFDSDNFIGAIPQKNHRQDNWYKFFMKQRLQYQVDLLPVNSINQEVRTLWTEFTASCDILFSAHSPKASLLHGDLWQGNVAQIGTEVCLFDPATYYGDAETDLAMLELFGSPSGDFYRGYESIQTIASGYKKRRTFYNLYHVLNHSNLFGNSYSQQALGMMQQIISWGRQ